MKLVKETRNTIFLEFELDEGEYPRLIRFMMDNNISPVLKGLEITLGTPHRFSATFTSAHANKILTGFCEPSQKSLDL